MLANSWLYGNIFSYHDMSLGAGPLNFAWKQICFQCSRGGAGTEHCLLLQPFVTILAAVAVGTYPSLLG